MIKVYGSGKTRAHRTIWALDEIGLAYEVIPVALAEGILSDPALEAINPNGRVPAIVDGDFSMWESLAINIYLAGKYASDLAPRTLEEEARTIQWTIWAVTEIEKSLFIIAANASIFPDQADVEEVLRAERRLSRPLAALERSLSSDYLLGERFTIVDLNVASVLAIAHMARLDLTPWPKVEAYLERCIGRPKAFDPGDILARQPRPDHWADIIA